MSLRFAALSYRVRAGATDQVRRIFSPQGFQRAASPAVVDAAGREVGYMAATALFLKDTTMVRISQYEGEFDDLGRHIARLPGARRAEEALAGWLDEPGRRCGGTPDEFLANFRRNTMTPVANRTYQDRVSAITAVHRRLRPGGDDRVCALFATETGIGEPERLHAVAAFVRDGDLVEVIQHEGEPAAAIEELLALPGRRDLERELSDLLAEPGRGKSLATRVMPSISQFSVADRVGTAGGD
ncbi:SchA/CurD-like domain-containing protein [Fodinicola feengrottensis]|uniref:SchA/CurD-like domain-containing protein n=1 Tax=Fodinicola feengrottensis TaxID=435914 RepID=A0ABN2I968_9ACTN|nr:SchA/CurD-like domain-containing protein [Fodinicola feengrottensis]